MGALSRTLRVTSALLLVGAGGAAVLAAQRVPADHEPGISVVREVRVPAGATTLVCHSAPDLPEGAVAYDADFNPVPVEASALLALASFPRGAGAGAGTFTTVGGAQTALTGSDALLGTAVFGDPGWAVLEPSAEEAALGAGAGTWRVDAGDLRGLYATPCLAPATDLWLVGGATTLGRSAALELVNAGETTATVTVDGWGVTGALDLPLLASVSLAPRSATPVLVEASAADVERLALHVTATGGRVSATVLDSALTGLTPQGIDAVVPTLAPATELVIPGVALVAAADVETGDPAADANVLRLVNPGTEAAVATVELLGADGAVAVPGAARITIDAGAVFDTSLAGLPAGEYAVHVTSDQPLTGAVQVARAATGQGGDAVAMDRAWAVATAAVTRASLVVPPLADAASLVLTNAGGEDAVVRVTPYGDDGAAGEPFDVEVPAGASATVPVAGALVLESDVAVHAAAVLTAEAADGQLVSVLPATADAAALLTVGVVVVGN